MSKQVAGRVREIAGRAEARIEATRVGKQAFRQAGRKGKVNEQVGTRQVNKVQRTEYYLVGYIGLYRLERTLHYPHTRTPFCEIACRSRFASLWWLLSLSGPMACAQGPYMA